jgi:hypothetical protein
MVKAHFLTGIHVCMNSLEQRVERDISNILVARKKKTAENINCENSQAGFGFDSHNRQDGFVQNRVSNIFRRFRVCRNLRENVVHQLARRTVVFAENSKKTDNSY